MVQSDTSQVVAVAGAAAEREEPFRFFDNREKYLLFVSTCNEKQMIADRVAHDIRHMQPKQPALRLFDAGMGDATVLTRVMRFLHNTYPTVPQLIVGKEISHEDVRISLEKMADRFHEHPATVLVLTNMRYSEAPQLYPRSKQAQGRLNWREAPLEGDSAYEFDQQITALNPLIQDWWRTVPSARTGNPVYESPSVLIIYRKDQEWPLAPVIPQRGSADNEYDIVMAAQPFRARSPADSKVKTVLAPLARSLAPGGYMVVIQSTGKDPGMEVVHGIWPDDNPFQTPRQALLRELHAQLDEGDREFRYINLMDTQALFRYHLQVPHRDNHSNIGTSALLAAWNAVIYVAQIDDDRLMDAMTHGRYLEVTSEVLEKYDGLWFTDESFAVTRRP